MLSGGLNDGSDLVMGSLDCFTIFNQLVDQMILDIHNFKPEDKHKSDLNIEPIELPEIDADIKQRATCQLKFSRNI